MKYAGKSEKYKGVYFGKENKEIYWFAKGSIKNLKFSISAKNEREAALKYDMKMIEVGKEPKNILKRKLL